MNVGGSKKERSSVFLNVFISLFLVSILIVSTVPVSLASVACNSNESNEGRMIESLELDNSHEIYVEKKVWNGSAWADLANADLNDTLRFKIKIVYYKNCLRGYKATDIRVVDTLPPCLSYSNNATIIYGQNEFYGESGISGQQIFWNLTKDYGTYSGIELYDPLYIPNLRSVSIFFDATVVGCTDMEGEQNVATVTAHETCCGYDLNGYDNATVIVSCLPPIANFTYEPTIPTVQELVWFNSTSWDIDGSIVNYSWDFGDGNYSYEQKTTHRYAEVATYNVTLNVTDDGGASDEIMKQITVVKGEPLISNPFPSNGSTQMPLAPTLTITVKDLNGDKMNITWCSNSSGVWNVFGVNNSVPDGTYSQKNSNFSSYNTTYWWSVNITDGIYWNNKTYHFLTRQKHYVSAPVNFKATTYNRTQINLTWSHGENATHTYIERNTSSYWDMGEGTSIYNGTQTSFNDDNLIYGSTYYYQAWSWDDIDHVWSVSYSSDNANTDVNAPPSFGMPTPENGSTGQYLSFIWSIDIVDADDDVFDWWINCSNGNATNGTKANNGIKNLSIDGLCYNTTYKVWVNATDGIDWTKKWYKFTTKETIAPFIIDNSAGSAGTGDCFVVNVTVFDEDDVDGVWIEYWFDSGVKRNVSMTNTNGHYWEYDCISIPVDSLSSLYYNISANDTLDNWSYLNNVCVVVNDDDKPSLISDNSDNNGTTGDPFSFSVNVDDNIDPESELIVKVNWNQNGQIENETMIWNDSSDQWELTIILDDGITAMNYAFYIEDKAGNSIYQNGKYSPVSVDDNDPPIITDITGDTYGSTGETTTISINFSDNIGVTTATLYYKNASADNWGFQSILSGTADIVIPLDSDENWYYYVTVNDAADNGPVGNPSVDGSIYYTIAIIDNDSPMILDVLATPSSTSQNGFINITCRVTDNIAIDTVTLNITCPDETMENISITGNRSGDTYYCNRTYSVIGTYYYFIWVNDTTGNIDKSPQQQFWITPTGAPVITINSYLSAGTGDNYIMNVTVFDEDDKEDGTDQIQGNGAATVSMDDVSMPVGGSDSGYLKANNIADDVGSCELILSWDPAVVSVIEPVDGSDFDGMYYYLDSTAGTLSITAISSVSLTGDFNIARIEFEAVGSAGDVCDLEISSCELLTADPVPDVINHDVVNGAVTIGDDVDGVWIEYWFNSSFKINESMTNTGGNYWESMPISIPKNSTDDLYCNISAKGAKGNWSHLDNVHVYVCDDDPPIITDITGNITGTTGEVTTISVVFSDDIGVTNASLYYKNESNGGWNVMSILNGSIDFNIPFNSVDDWYYYVIVDDAAGNGPVGDPSVDGSNYYTITVEDNDPPEIHNVTALPIAQNPQGYINITAEVIDNIGVHIVKANISGPTGFLTKNITLSQNNKTWCYNTTYDVMGAYSYFIWANDSYDNCNKSTLFFFYVTNPPSSPENPAGPTSVRKGNSADYSTSAIDPDGDQVQYRFDWDASGNHDYSNWTALQDSGTYITMAHTWYSSGTYYVKAQARDGCGFMSNWSEALIVHVTSSTYSPGNEKVPPVANASAGEPYEGYVDEEIVFNGSQSYDPDGEIISWQWEFGDGTNGTGEITPHIYTHAGKYTVTLMVTDADGKTDTDTTYANIISPPSLNNPPSTPEIDGPQKGKKNTEYEYTALSTDVDNDSIKYTFDWGDGKKNTTEFLPNGVAAYQMHSWSVAGIYIVKVTAFDNKTYSKTNETNVLIDVHIVDGIGYLIDSDSNGIYDFFHNDTSGMETEVEKQDNGTYLLDDDGDDSWDYIYDPDTDILTKYSESKTGNTALYILIFGLFLVILILLIVYFASGKKEEQKESTERKNHEKSKKSTDKTYETKKSTGETKKNKVPAKKPAKTNSTQKKPKTKGKKTPKKTSKTKETSKSSKNKAKKK